MCDIMIITDMDLVFYGYNIYNHKNNKNIRVIYIMNSIKKTGDQNQIKKQKRKHWNININNQNKRYVKNKKYHKKKEGIKGKEIEKEEKMEKDNISKECIVRDTEKNEKSCVVLDKKYPSINFASVYLKSLRERDRLYFPNSDSSKISFNNDFISLLKLLEKSQKEKNVERDEERGKNNECFCKNSSCDHDEKTTVEISNITEIKNINDLLELGCKFHCKSNKMFYNINLRVLHGLTESLNDINNIIGMKNVKDKLVDQILYFLQGYHNKGKKCLECIDCDFGITCMKNQSDMLHTAITGPPGVGKTMLAKHLAILYNKMGILKTNKFKIVSRSDLVGKYLGETAMKTQSVIDEADGGVLFIDEAYSLGNTGERDFYSKECIDTLTKNLSEKKTFICIIAGYKESLEKCFFSHNEGLSRRFTFRYDLEKYSWDELKKIFEIKVKQENFSIKYNAEIDEMFRNNEKYFINNGGDMETLYLKTKMAHCRNILIKPEEQFILNTDDVKKGIQDLIETRKNKKNNNLHYMYI